MPFIKGGVYVRTPSRALLMQSFILQQKHSEALKILALRVLVLCNVIHRNVVKYIAKIVKSCQKLSK